MAFNYYKDLTTINRDLRSSRTISYIVIHYTGNQTDKAKSNANYFRSVNRGASAHYFVDETDVYQIVEDKDIAWAVGRNYGSNNLFGIVTNANSISIEMCSNGGSITTPIFNNTVELTKQLMAKYGIPASNVVRHFDVCSKNCPGWSGWLPGDETIWNYFKQQIVYVPIPKPTAPKYKNKKRYIAKKKLYIYKGASTKSGKWKYSEFTSGLKERDKDKNGLVDKGQDVGCYGTAKDSNGNVWVKVSPKGEYWAKGFYDGKIYIG